MDTLFSLDASLTIGIVLAALVVALGVLYLVTRVHTHQWMRKFEDGRMFMSCATCHKQTPGWQIGKRSSDKDAA
jgi:hypothetical protein